jgi:hypothetical protein
MQCIQHCWKVVEWTLRALGNCLQGDDQQRGLHGGVPGPDGVMGPVGMRPGGIRISKVFSSAGDVLPPGLFLHSGQHSRQSQLGQQTTWW